jgi:hypothetical protein
MLHSGYFWIHPRILSIYLCIHLSVYLLIYLLSYLLLCQFIYLLFLYGLFKYSVNLSEYIAFNDRMINK